MMEKSIYSRLSSFAKVVLLEKFKIQLKAKRIKSRKKNGERVNLYFAKEVLQKVQKSD